MPKAKHLFGENIEPKCQYCFLSGPAKEKGMMMCQKHGLVEEDYCCGRYEYDPLRRVPKRQPKLPTYKPEDFEL